MNGRKLYTMPISTALSVYISFLRPMPIHSRKRLMMPVSSSSVIHAYVRSRKFIHIGMTNSTTMMCERLKSRPARNSAAG